LALEEDLVVVAHLLKVETTEVEITVAEITTAATTEEVTGRRPNRTSNASTQPELTKFLRSVELMVELLEDLKVQVSNKGEGSERSHLNLTMTTTLNKPTNNSESFYRNLTSAQWKSKTLNLKLL
jgi:hypothetical protein